MKWLLPMLLIVVAGCSTEVEGDDRPKFQIDPEQSFRLELGRGSGWHGLATVRITHDGTVLLHRQNQKVEGRVSTIIWEWAGLKLSAEQMERLLSAVEKHELMDLQRAYHDPEIADGTQWVLLIQQGRNEKSVYFNNLFPKSITHFADELDRTLTDAGLEKVTWKPVPQKLFGQHDQDLWDSIKR